MKKGWLVLVCAVAVTLVLILTAYALREDRTGLAKADYAGLLRMQAAKEAPNSGPLPESKDAGFRDKSMATGVDSSPTLSAG